MPVGTDYLANSADTVESYANSYVNFTTNLITNTFEALLHAHHSQMEAYAEFVNTLSQGLTTYINETNNDVSIAEVLNFVQNLPLVPAGVIDEGDIISYNPNAGEDTPAIEVKRVDGSASNRVSDFLADVAGVILPNPGGDGGNSIIGGIQELIGKPKELESQLHQNPFQAFGNSSDGSKEKENAFIDVIRTVISYNKYGSLERFVDKGVLQMVVNAGTVETTFDMELKESYQDRSSNSFRQRDRTVNKDRYVKRRGLIGSIFLGKKMKRDVKNRRVLTVTKRRSSVSNSTSGKAQIGATVRIDFSTVYDQISNSNDD